MQALASSHGVAPGQWLGMLGGGQLGRMLALAAHNLGIKTVVLDPAGSASPANIRAWTTWAAEPLDEELLRDVQAIFAPVRNVGHVEGLPQNN